jgi:hypothetical protein
MPKALVLVAAFGVIGCAGKLDHPEKYRDSGLNDVGACSLNLNVELSIFRDKCGECHGGTKPDANLDLASPNVWARLDGVASQCGGKPLVAKSAIPSGVLLDRLAGTSACGPQEPSGRAPLSDAEIECVASWISGKIAGTDPNRLRAGAGVEP